MSLTASYRTEIVIPKPQLASLRGNVKGTPCMEIMQLALEKKYGPSDDLRPALGRAHAWRGIETLIRLLDTLASSNLFHAVTLQYESKALSGLREDIGDKDAKDL